MKFTDKIEPFISTQRVIASIHSSSFDGTSTPLCCINSNRRHKKLRASRLRPTHIRRRLQRRTSTTPRHHHPRQHTRKRKRPFDERRRPARWPGAVFNPRRRVQRKVRRRSGRNDNTRRNSAQHVHGHRAIPSELTKKQSRVPRLHRVSSFGRHTTKTTARGSATTHTRDHQRPTARTRITRRSTQHTRDKCADVGTNVQRAHDRVQRSRDRLDLIRSDYTSSIHKAQKDANRAMDAALSRS